MSIAHQVLLKLGYSYRPISRLKKELFLRKYSILSGVYIKQYNTKHGVFEVAMIQANDPHIELPTVFVIDMPQNLQGRLTPHISHEGYLCYVEQMEADWNPNNLDELYKAVDIQITTTLDIIANAIDNKTEGDLELDNEFVSYWSSTIDLYLLSELRRNSSYTSVLARPIDKESSRSNEYITVQVDKKEQDLRANKYLQNWIKQRDLELVRPESPSIKTHYVWVQPSRLSGIEWPPQNIKEVLSWLELVDFNARDHLVRCLSNSKVKRNVVVLDIEKQDPVSLYLEIDVNRVDYQFSVRKTRRKRKHTSFKNLIGVLTRKGFCSKFARLSVTKADKSAVLSRNQQREFELSSKNIALIGCGTIGGYLAELLVRNGAGLGDKFLHLYDKDTLKPHNFSRHTLSVSDFGNNKASALAATLMNSIHLAKNISGFDGNFPINEKILSKYDIVIDATGRPPVSKRLAFITRQMSVKRPTIVHVFNDGNGRAAKVLVDINISCYGCMTIDKSIHQDHTDERFKDLELSKEKKVSCGNTYTVYDAGVSQISAAMALEGVLNTLNANMPWTYSEFILDPRYRTGKRKVLKPQKHCVVCNGV
ncbi:E2/UBC family protein [Aliivibrio fischeri]|uniref:E2/UBC family protein n=1 Tax=Aliivibrio fischeri TaxID=668 RepID=UPI0002F4B889|nr:E2/UBC family protein [Aliivibrio fischeri]